MMNNLSANRGSTNNPVLFVLKTVKHIVDFDTWNNTGRNEYNRKPISMVIGKTRPTIWVDWTGC